MNISLWIEQWIGLQLPIECMRRLIGCVHVVRCIDGGGSPRMGDLMHRIGW